MKPGIERIAIPVLTVLLLALFLLRGQQESGQKGIAVCMDVQILSSEQFDTCAAELEEKAAVPGTILFNGCAAPFDEEKSLLYLPAGRDAEGCFHASGRLEPASPGDHLYFLEDACFDDPGRAVAEGHAFDWILVSGSSFCRGQAVLTGLPVLSLDWDRDLEIQGKKSYIGRFTVCMPESAGTVSDRCSFHVRGNTSTFYEKKSYRISLQDRNGDRKKENLLGIRDDDDWILLPMLTDTSRIREKTAYDLWNRMQAPAGADGVVSSSVHYTELLINNQYFGIYGLMTPVDGKLLGLTERDLLYKINTWEVPSDEEYRAFDSMEEVCKPNGISYVDLKYPARALAADGWEPMRLFQGYVYGAMSPEELEAAGVVIDRESILRYNLFCTLTHAMDNTWKNTFLVCRKQADGSYRLYRDIWDLNYTFGDYFAGKIDNFYTAHSARSATEIVPFKDTGYDFEVLRASDPEGVFTDSCRIWKEIRDAGISAESVCADAESSMAELIRSGAMDRESQRWPQPGPSADLTEFRRWVTDRFSYLDDIYGYTD